MSAAINVVGISALYHDAACCVVQNGRLIAAAPEERFSRIKHDRRLPVQALRWCLRRAGLTIGDVDTIAFYESPSLKRQRQQQCGVPLPLADRPVAGDDDDVAALLGERLGYDGPVRFYPHHLSHAASSYYFSGFDEAAILTVDGVGEWATTTYGHGAGGDITLLEQVDFPHSLGLLYATLTAYLGFRVNGGEYKVMGLAAYGRPRYQAQIAQLFDVADGQLRLALDFFDFVAGERMYSSRLIELFGRPPRRPESAIEPFHCDVAASLQQALEAVLLAMATHLRERVDSRNLCMAGGVALNSVAIGRIRRESGFARLFVQPAAGDSGGCLGAAALAQRELDGDWSGNRLRDVYLGPSWSADEVALLLSSAEIEAEDWRDREEGLLDRVVERLQQGDVVAWFEGRMEFGPRALGARSIVADPRLPQMRDQINSKVKRREAFRPFAPGVLAEQAAAHFELNHPSPFMLETCRVRSPLDLPAVTHVDGSARPQTVDQTAAPRYRRLLERFYEQTGCPILLNTSFNLRGEPIVCSPVDALLTFARSEIDLLVIEQCVIERAKMPANWPLLCTLWLADFERRKAGIRHDALYTFV